MAHDVMNDEFAPWDNELSIYIECLILPFLRRNRWRSGNGALNFLNPTPEEINILKIRTSWERECIEVERTKASLENVGIFGIIDVNIKKKRKSEP